MAAKGALHNLFEKNQLDGAGGFVLASFLISTVEIVWGVQAISQTGAIC